MYRGRGKRRRLLVALAAATLAPAAAAAAAGSGSSPGAATVAAFNSLPASDFPATVSRARLGEHGTLRFRMRFMGGEVTLEASAVGRSGGEIGTLSRTAGMFVLRFTRASYRVAPVRLPDGLTIAAQTISLDPRAVSTLVWSRRSGALTSSVHWLVSAPNTLYDDSHTIAFVDHGARRFSSFRRLGYGRFSFRIVSSWRGAVKLRQWRVSGHSLPGGAVAITGAWSGSYVLAAKGA